METNVHHKQMSSDNPGWQGSGVPVLIKYAKLWLRNFLQDVKNGRLRTIPGRTLAMGTDLLNFSLFRNKKRVYCPCCDWSGPSFLASSNWRATTFQSRCPQCDSRSRHRGLAAILPNLITTIPQGSLLVFAPERVVLEQLQRLTKSKLVTTDLFSHDVDYPGEDIQSLSFASQTYAMIICNHVLEHVEDDDRALSECARVLKPKGIAVFTVPGNFHKLKTWVFEKPDNNGHYRHYGLDIQNSMQSYFREVEVIDMELIAEKKWKVRQKDMVFICRQ